MYRMDDRCPEKPESANSITLYMKVILPAIDVVIEIQVGLPPAEDAVINISSASDGQPHAKKVLIYKLDDRVTIEVKFGLPPPAKDVVIKGNQ